MVPTKSEGLGASYSSGVFTISGLTIGVMFTFSLYMNNTSSVSNIDSFTGFTVVDSVNRSESSDAVSSFHYICMATNQTATVVTNNYPSTFTLMAYQA